MISSLDGSHSRLWTRRDPRTMSSSSSSYLGLEMMASLTASTDVYIDSGYALDTCFQLPPQQPQYLAEPYEEKPPLTALGEVIELIGQPWVTDTHQWTSNPTVLRPLDTKTDPNQGQVQTQNVNPCNVCLQQINDPFLLKIGESHVHEACARCVICSDFLDDKCFEKHGNLYCAVHYYSECSPYKCSGCGFGITPSDMVYKLKEDVTYHVGCHACFICGKQLTPGEQIVVNDFTKAVSCSHHQQYTGKDEFFREELDIKDVDMKPLMLPEKKEKNKSKNGGSENVLQNIAVIPQYPFEMYAFGEMCSDDSRFMKRRGPRTTIKQSQLDVLNRIFSSTPKPSKHARAKLALETGLSMRVIQVWFQNRRSKERRLKHLCNFLRHYEQKGLMPPSFNFNPEDGTLMGEPFSPSMLHSFNMDDSFSYETDNDNGDISS